MILRSDNAYCDKIILADILLDDLLEDRRKQFCSQDLSIFVKVGLSKKQCEIINLNEKKIIYYIVL